MIVHIRPRCHPVWILQISMYCVMHSYNHTPLRILVVTEVSVTFSYRLDCNTTDGLCMPLLNILHLYA